MPSLCNEVGFVWLSGGVVRKQKIIDVKARGPLSEFQKPSKYNVDGLCVSNDED